MAKRRTKKQKIKARHQFSISWQPSSPSTKTELKKPQSKANVKGQIKNLKAQKKHKITKRIMARNQAKDSSLASIKRDLAKSLVIASLILGLEVVIYLYS